MPAKQVFIIPWKDKRNGLSHGIKPGCFFDKSIANETAKRLSESDCSLIFTVESLSIFDEIPTTWYGTGGKGGTS